MILDFGLSFERTVSINIDKWELCLFFGGSLISEKALPPANYDPLSRKGQTHGRTGEKIRHERERDIANQITEMVDVDDMGNNFFTLELWWLDIDTVQG